MGFMQTVLDELNKMTADFNVSFHLLGDMGNSHFCSAGEYMASTTMTLPSRMQITALSLYVYCDILEHVILGNVTAPSLT